MSGMIFGTVHICSFTVLHGLEWIGMDCVCSQGAESRQLWWLPECQCCLRVDSICKHPSVSYDVLPVHSFVWCIMPVGPAPGHQLLCACAWPHGQDELLPSRWARCSGCRDIRDHPPGCLALLCGFSPKLLRHSVRYFDTHSVVGGQCTGPRVHSSLVTLLIVTS
jgi:hypothetical protein